MTEQEHPGYPSKPFRIEVVVEAPRDAVWRALTDPEEIGRWFGWDYDGLDAEIRYIFVDHATARGPDLLQFDNGQVIEVEADGPRTVVRVVHPGELGDASWDDLYDEVVQGWRTFFQQLRFHLERHPGQDRRTVFLSGQVVPAEAFAALEAAAPGETWDDARHQRSVAVDRWGGGLVSLVTSIPKHREEAAQGQVTVTTYGLDDAAFDRVRDEWTAWWSGLARDVDAKA
jgi:uncharacterized protein YndB with AHSA1/START domain